MNYINHHNPPVLLHAGETKFMPKTNVDKEYLESNYINDNLIHAALLKNLKRIGHGLAIERNNLLRRIITKKQIPIEVSPISNDRLGYVPLHEHPFLKLIRMGLEATISPDDPGFFGYDGVSMDWFRVLMETDIRPSEVYHMLVNSVKYTTIKEVAEMDINKIKQKIFDQLIEFYDSLDCESYEKPKIENKPERILIDKREKDILQAKFDEKMNILKVFTKLAS